jgi:hypothetical protein
MEGAVAVDNELPNIGYPIKLGRHPGLDPGSRFFVRLDKDRGSTHGNTL